MRCAIYLRVSSRDGSQSTENQLRQLREYAAAREWDVVATYEDHERGSKGKKERKDFASMLDAAGRREFDVLLCWSLDRFTREGTRAVHAYLDRLDGWNVGWHFFMDPMLSTADEFTRDVVIAVRAGFARYELARLGERTKAGMERAKAQGKRIGRPNKVQIIVPVLRDLAPQIRLDGSLPTASDLQRALRAKGHRVSVATVKRALAELRVV